MKTRAKFYCAEKNERGFPGSDVKQYGVVMYPVTGGSDENKQFFASTPSGKIELSLVNPDAAAVFEPGKTYYIDISPAE